MKRKPNEIGKILRKLRIDAGETAGVMAGKLGVTASYLSAIELGKRRMTEEIQTQIVFMYELSADDRETITRASADKPLKLDLLGATAAQIEVHGFSPNGFGNLKRKHCNRSLSSFPWTSRANNLYRIKNSKTGNNEAPPEGQWGAPGNIFTTTAENSVLTAIHAFTHINSRVNQQSASTETFNVKNGIK